MRRVKEATTTMREYARQRTIPRTATVKAAAKPRPEDILPNGILGTIKAIKKAEGYGFVTHGSTGEDYFFHRSAVRESSVAFEDLRLDQAVVFEPSDGPKGLRASLVRAI
jgi:cold shock protein